MMPMFITQPASTKHVIVVLRCTQEAKNGTPWMPSGNTAKAGVSMLGQWRYGILGLPRLCLLCSSRSYLQLYRCSSFGEHIYIYATIEICFHLELLNWVSIASCDHGGHKHQNHLKPRLVLTLGEPWQTLTQRKPQRSPFAFGTLLAMIH